MLLSDTTIGMITEFNNLPEDRKYLASASVYYSEQIAQRSTQLITSEYCHIILIIFIIGFLLSDTFDISDVNYTVQSEAIHLTVHYVEGSESPYCFYAELKCVSITIHEVFLGSNGMINTSIFISPNELCSLLVTDADAMNFICTVAAVTVESITVPIHKGSIATTTATTTTTTTVNYSLVHNTDPGVNMTLLVSLVAGILIAAFTGM